MRVALFQVYLHLSLLRLLLSLFIKLILRLKRLISHGWIAIGSWNDSAFVLHEFLEKFCVFYCVHIYLTESFTLLCSLGHFPFCDLIQILCMIDDFVFIYF